MLVAIDVGNTQTVIGVFDRVDGAVDLVARNDGELPGLAHHWRIATKADRTPDEHALLLIQLLTLVGRELPRLDDGRFPAHERTSPADGIVISSSVPTVTHALREMAEAWFSCTVVVVEPGIKTGMPILYENPREVGADRIVNAVAARDLYGGPAIVVDLGTATTFDAISSEGEYLGGAIVPGIEISMDALVDRAAALRGVELIAPRRAIGRTTVESMQAGAIFGFASLVDGLCRRIAAELGGGSVILTGGLGGLIAPHSELPVHHEPWLTLHGLSILYRRNAVIGEQEPAGGSPGGT